MKDWLYDRIVRRNDRIRTEYERYVRGHFEEHRKKRLKHWFVLLILGGVHYFGLTYMNI